mmetsp:Transcript_1233/g.4836  ORF Transcript_1233/g.4836 Transcript_1233/m.4836 type:complete len:365 (-) Transcript_1233:595-1689(-)
MRTAPTGAVTTMASTAMVSTASPRFSASEPAEMETAVSSAMDPMAACTVALGSHASAMNACSDSSKPVPSMQRKAAMHLTTRPAKRAPAPMPRTSRSTTEMSTAAPMSPNSIGCPTSVHTVRSHADASSPAWGPSSSSSCPPTGVTAEATPSGVRAPPCFSPRSSEPARARRTGLVAAEARGGISTDAAAGAAAGPCSLSACTTDPPVARPLHEEQQHRQQQPQADDAHSLHTALIKRSVPPSSQAARAAIPATMTPSAPPPSRCTRRLPSTATTPMPIRRVPATAPPPPRAGIMRPATRPITRPKAAPAMSSRGLLTPALTGSPSEKARLRHTPKPLMAITSSNDAAAMMRVGMPLSTPRPWS